MASLNEVAASIMETMCNDDSHGYTQGSRWGDGSTCSIVVDGQQYNFAGGDRDCSASIISAYQAAGLDVNSTYTGNMRNGFLATGLFEWHGMDFTAQRGDIYLNEADHTAMCTSSDPDLLAEFACAEDGGAFGVEGDQTGHEAYIHDYYDFPWDGILHFTGGDASGGTEPSQQTEQPSQAAPSVRYRAMTDEDGWLDEVTDLADFAGIQGHQITYLAIDLGGHGWYQVKTNNGWLDRVTAYNTDDLVNGAAGDGSPITAVRVYYDTPNPSSTGYFKAQYRVSEVGQDYFDWQYDDETWNGQDGFAGNGDAPLDRFQLTLSR